MEGYKLTVRLRCAYCGIKIRVRTNMRNVHCEECDNNNVVRRKTDKHDIVESIEYWLVKGGW